MVAPSQRREMAQWAVAQRSATIGLACQAFGISQTCYRYRAKLDAENAWASGKPSQRAQDDARLKVAIEAVHAQSRQTYAMDGGASFTMTGIMPGCGNVYNCAFTTVRAKQLRGFFISTILSMTWHSFRYICEKSS